MNTNPQTQTHKNYRPTLQLQPLSVFQLIVVVLKEHSTDNNIYFINPAQYLYMH